MLGTAVNAILNASGDAILVSDQTGDVVHEFDLNGNYLGIFAPAGGANNAILNNIRGMALDASGNLLVTTADATNVDAVAKFDTNGNYLGNFIASGAGGLNSPFDIYGRTADWLVASIDSDNVLRFDLAGAPLGVFAGVNNFPEQIAEAGNSNVLAANFGGTQEGVVEFTSTGTFVGVYDPATLGGYRGVYELPGGTILTTTGTGVHEINRSGALVQSKITEVSGRFIEYVVIGDCSNPADIPWASTSPITGTAAGGSATDVTVTLDSTGLPAGAYTGKLCIFSNDPDPGPANETELVLVPLTLTVTATPPNIDVSPLSLSSSQAPNTTTQQPLNVGNTGGSALTWSIFEDVSGSPDMVDWSDNFDSYATGSQLHGQGGWKGWDNNPAAGALTSSAQARSAPNSAAIVGASDLVHEYSGYTSGQWVYTAWQYVPTNFTGQSYFILLNTYNDAGTTQLVDPTLFRCVSGSGLRRRPRRLQWRNRSAPGDRSVGRDSGRDRPHCRHAGDLLQQPTAFPGHVDRPCQRRRCTEHRCGGPLRQQRVDGLLRRPELWPPRCSPWPAMRPLTSRGQVSARPTARLRAAALRLSRSPSTRPAWPKACTPATCASPATTPIPAPATEPIW